MKTMTFTKLVLFSILLTANVVAAGPEFGGEIRQLELVRSPTTGEETLILWDAAQGGFTCLDRFESLDVVPLKKEERPHWASDGKVITLFVNPSVISGLKPILIDDLTCS